MTGSIEKLEVISTSNVRRSFNRAASSYDQYAVLQRIVNERLLESFDQLNISPEVILDLGSGTGFASKALKKRFRNSLFYELDISESMLKQSRKNASWFSRQRQICADGMSLPISENVTDLVFSSLMLQWCSDLDAVFKEQARVLKPGGVFIFASFGPDTLKELRESWSNIDQATHVNDFVDMHDVGDALIRNGFEGPVLSVEEMTLTYDDVWQLMRELKAIGAHNINQGRRKTLTGRSRLENMIKEYDRFMLDKKYPATFEIVYGHAWVSEKNQQIKNISGVQSISLEELKQTLPRRDQAR